MPIPLSASGGRPRPLSLPTLLSALAILVPVLSIGCGPAGDGANETSEEAQEDTAPAERAGALEAELWLDGVEIGHQVDPDGAIPVAQRADEFAPGERVYVSMEVSDAPELAEVHVTFRDPAGEIVAEDAKKVPAGARYLYFDSGETTQWSPGTYRLGVAVDGEPTAERDLTITRNPLEPKGEPG